MPKSAPVPPPRRSIGSASGGGGASKMKLKNQQLKLLLENEFTIENFVNQSLVTQSEDDDDESDDEDVTGVKLSFRLVLHYNDIIITSLLNHQLLTTPLPTRSGAHV